MCQSDIDLFFMDPSTPPHAPDSFGLLYLLRRDINQCLRHHALWPGAMGILAGVDLLAKYLKGRDGPGVGKRFEAFIQIYFRPISIHQSEVIYQLRNALLHAFGLYSKDKAGNVYRFVLYPGNKSTLIEKRGDERYNVDIGRLHDKFELAVKKFKQDLDQSKPFQTNFEKMFLKYGKIWVG